MPDPADLDSFRRDVRSWLDANAPAAVRGVLTSIEGQGNWGGRRPTFDPPEMKTWLERAVARGWTAPTWPIEYGGGGLSEEQAKVLAQEIAAAKLPPPLIGFGLEMIGPTLLAVRQRGAEARAPAADRARRDPLVPGLLGAGLGLRSRVAPDARGARRRPLHRERPEGLDLVRRPGRLDLRARAHRSRARRSRRASRSC